HVPADFDVGGRGRDQNDIERSPARHLIRDAYVAAPGIARLGHEGASIAQNIRPQVGLTPAAAVARGRTRSTQGQRDPCHWCWAIRITPSEVAKSTPSGPRRRSSVPPSGCPAFRLLLWRGSSSGSGLQG